MNSTASHDDIGLPFGEEQAELDAADLAQFIAEIKRDAVAMLGTARAEVWLGRRQRYGEPSVNDLRSMPDKEMYREFLREEATRCDKRDAGDAKAREQTLRMATTHFRAPERASLWMRSKHPKLGMRSPNDVCVEPNGVETCRKVLR